MEVKDYFEERQKRWDTYYHNICVAVASKSPCLSRQIGAILVKENVIVATGYNGPARGFKHCEAVLHPMEDINVPGEAHFSRVCPRHAKGYASGEGLSECPATHAEANCIISAARIGASVSRSIFYMNCIIPCKDCMNLLVNAGVFEIVVDDLTPYHDISIDIAKAANMKLRRFNL